MKVVERGRKSIRLSILQRRRMKKHGCCAFLFSVLPSPLFRSACESGGWRKLGKKGREGCLSTRSSKALTGSSPRQGWRGAHQDIDESPRQGVFSKWDVITPSRYLSVSVLAPLKTSAIVGSLGCISISHAKFWPDKQKRTHNTQIILIPNLFLNDLKYAVI